ncbi:MAG: hypothetical protein IT279_12030, partial [Ignavibacteriaceae bacterium]|nr:hypothetical protein [Ignavibacteriaceae bacterium]
MKKVLFLVITMFLQISAQQSELFFEEASVQYQVPTRILKAIAFSETRGVHIVNDAETHQSCIGIPHVYGIMGLRDDNWFGRSLVQASELSGFSVDLIKSDERTNILA